MGAELLDGTAVGVGFLFQATSGRTRGSGLRLHKGRFRSDIRGCFFREGVKPSSLEVFKNGVDVAPGDMG